MTEQTIRSVITPNDKFVRTVFETSKAYLIDIFQREYKWEKDNVATLLNDIEMRFNQHPRTKTDPKEIQADVQSQFEPYYLNTFLTHSTAANVSIVDGQQRLTTLLLIIIKIYRVLDVVEADDESRGKTFTKQSIEKLILERDDFGDAEKFKIFNSNREEALRSILDGSDYRPQDETQQRIVDNYGYIDDYYEKFFRLDDDQEGYDLTKLTYYITYLLDRISIVEIKIEKQRNVAMIFEVVNDRGLGLKPYEILKGKLIGELSERQRESANDVWVDLQNRYYAADIRHSTESSIDLDTFFRAFFRAKFADTENDYEKFEDDYHYEMYRNSRIREYFRNFEDLNHLHKLIVEDIKYFAELYLEIRTTYKNPYLIYNKLLDQNQQYLLILSAVTLNDREAQKKITAVAKSFDQFHTMIRLMDIYDSNKFQRLIYPINRDIRDLDFSGVRGVFESKLISSLEEEEVVEKGELKTIEDIFRFDRLRFAQNRWTNFSKYILMRIDRHLSDVLDKPSYAGGDLEELEEHFNKSTRRRYGMHLEHIYAYNESNKALFRDENGVFDEQEFNLIRNRMGMVLLLKDSQNISSNNEPYKEKVGTYKTSNFIWNEMLVGHLHGLYLRNLPDWQVEEVDPDKTGAFPIDKVEARQKSLFKAIKSIWFDELDV